MNDLLVVGIASSAGGLEPLRELVANAVCHNNLTYVMVPHLSRENESALPSLLEDLSQLKIVIIEDGMEVKACHLYILPPGYYARVANGKLWLDARPDRGINLSANVLFKSLAENYKRNAVGVVLSGAAVGSDGSEGVTAIKKNHGHTFAQDPSTAKFPDMPLAAINTGCVDSILDAKTIGREVSLIGWVSQSEWH